jgi:hypothetical protein
MAEFRLDVSRETGSATLWMATEETGCGYKPILSWPSMEGVRDFALMLLEIDHRRKADTGAMSGKNDQKERINP